MDFKLDSFEKHNDFRGNLVVFLDKKTLTKKDLNFGQIYFVTFNKKGVVRGNHYHKKWREWFGVVEGILEVRLKDVFTGEEKEFLLDNNSEKYTRLEIGPNIIHAFKSISEKASLLNYANGEWSNDDTFAIKLI
ncbi:hypothetical protein COY87_05490 [Candidatus Roizmanbacteria bacterium CG_4_10_14_0_8_um_filter_33_9]|uniref:Sugar 3,4-ketoisomerase QdtA cupin domain-containing protein n=1 Tax=Candidatus Roizmanbacteria bacterium CG_4_10_14_0_8_um_filter_33_9 TaxID=1974826 RepID=A0A2M7QHW4_9BACT|nr:MAG: hypothetical protein COY87_05490 [Candidatus Roizmanbacteria bacterium CG_4_10_14_0_8_um_filter_33_9]